MAKKLSDVLRGTNSSRTRPGRTGSNPGVDYSSKMDDERDFVNVHDTEEFEDRVGNGSDVYNASNIKQTSDSRHGHTPEPKSQNQYRQNNEQVLDDRPVYTNTTTGQTSRNLPSDLRTRMGLQTGGTSSAPSASIRPQMRPSSNTAVSSSPRPIQRPVREENQASEEKEMMKRQLHFVKYAADEIMGHVDSVDDPEEWFQNKLSGLHSEIKGLHSYIEGDKRLRSEGSEDESVPGDPRVEPKDTNGRGKNLRVITGSVKESNDGSRTRTETEQARARFEKKMEKRENRRETEDDN